MPRVYLSLGSNHQRHHNLGKALALLQTHFFPIDLSAVYRSEAVDQSGSGSGDNNDLNNKNDLSDKNDYYNICAGFDTTLSLDAVRDLLREIEQQVGRDRDTPDQVAIDIDLLLYGDHVESGSQFTLPHPDISRYAHVLIPLQDIAPALRLPDSGQLLQHCRADLSDEEHLRRVDLVLHPEPSSR